MNEIARKLINGEFNLSQALYTAREGAKGDLKTFIDNEIDGYGNIESLPKYRILRCPILLDYQTPWGDIHREVEFDARPIIEQIKYDLNNVPFLDNIDSIIAGLKSMEGAAGINPFNSHMLSMISEVAVPSHPGSKVIGGGFKVQSQQLQSIVDSVKRELIKKLQDQPLTSTSISETTPILKKAVSITVFVSYAWENDEQNTRVMSFVNFLREKGYDARMDRSESQKETAVNFKKLMHEGVYKSDKIIVILSETYKKKADNLEGGVGEEVKIIQEEISRISNKYILVSFNPLSPDVISKILPSSLADREVLDLTRDQNETGFNTLFSKLSSVQISAFSEVAETQPEIKPKEIPPFKL